MRAFRKSGLSKYCGYRHSSASKPWPTVGQLLQNGTRVLVFSNRADTYYPADKGTRYLGYRWQDEVAAADWWHFEGDFMTSTIYTYTDLGGMVADCELASSGKFPINDVSVLAEG